MYGTKDINLFWYTQDYHFVSFNTICIQQFEPDFKFRQSTNMYTKSLLGTYQTGRMKFFLTCSTGFFGKRIIWTMNHWKTDHAIFNAFKPFIHIIFPQSQAFHNTSILTEGKSHNSNQWCVNVLEHLISILVAPRRSNQDWGPTVLGALQIDKIHLRSHAIYEGCSKGMKHVPFLYT